MQPENPKNQFIDDLHFIALGCAVVGWGFVGYTLINGASLYSVFGALLSLGAFLAAIIGLLLLVLKRKSVKKIRYYSLIFIAVIAASVGAISTALK